jgi:hypothetical protein
VPTVTTLTSAKLHNLLTPTPNITQTEQQMLAALTELRLTITVATVTTLALVRELFVLIYAEFNENPANGLVTDVTSTTGGRTDGRGLHIQRHSVLPIERLLTINTFRGIFQTVSSTVTAGRQADHSALKEH